MSKEFRLTEDHLTLLQNAYVDWEDAEYGAPAIDPKRPYGNSDVHGDVVGILDWDEFEYRSDEYNEQAHEVADLHRELEIAMKIVLGMAGEAARPGLYRLSTQNSDTWDRVGD